MAITNLNPYVNFNGNAAQAIELYERVLGARVETKMHMSEIPGGQIPVELKDRVMHCELRIGSLALMASDAMPNDEVRPGTNSSIALQFDNDEELIRVFDGLSAGGKASHPPHDAFFGSKFAMLTDPFGIQWMLVGPEKKR